MRTVFVGFFGMVGLGISHRLVVLPLVLSLVGPTAPMKEFKSSKAKKMEEDKEEPNTPRTEHFSDLGLDVTA